MNHTLSRRISDRNLAFAIGALLFISMIPILWVCLYATPRVDDFSYGLLAHRAIAENRGVLGAVQGALREVANTYINWQGTYTSVFLFALQPGVFGTQYYFIGGWLLMLSLIGSTLYLVNALVCRWLKLPKSWCWLIAVPILVSEIQFMPETFSGIYWYNGASYYTFPYCASQMLLGLLVSMECSSDHRHSRFVLAAVLSALLGGVNYVTVLVTAVLLATVAAWAFWKKSPNRWRYLVLLALILTGLAVSAAAPGNLVRGQGSLGKRSAVQSIAYSFLCGALLIYHRLRPGVVAVYLFILPLVLQAARKSGWKFRFPILVVGYGFCVMCTQFTSYLYTGFFTFPARMECIQFYFMHLWLLFSLFYFCGWADRYFARYFDKVIAWWQGHFGIVCAGICVLFLVGTFCWAPKANLRPVASIAAAKSLADGQAKQTYQDFRQMETTLLSHPGQECYVSEISVDPDISEPFHIVASEKDENYWVNSSIAQYYGCGKILLDTGKE